MKVLFNDKGQNVLQRVSDEEIEDGVFYVPEGIDVLGANLFKGNPNLKKLVLSNSVVEIKDFALFKCEALEEIVLSKKLNKLGKSVFSFTTIESISFPNGVVEIPEGTCAFCPCLKKVELGKSVKKIGNNAFSFCGNLKEINLPYFLETIGESAFHECKSLKEISAESVKEIGRFAFAECKNLRKVTISEITQVGEGAFIECPQDMKLYEAMFLVKNEIDPTTHRELFSKK